MRLRFLLALAVLASTWLVAWYLLVPDGAEKRVVPDQTAAPVAVQPMAPAAVGSPPEARPETPGLPPGWPEWSGPPSLGPGRKLTEQWCLEFARVVKPGEALAMRISSDGQWSDRTLRKGGSKLGGNLAPAELEEVAAALAGIDWTRLPVMRDKTYTAYHTLPKEYLGPLKFTGHSVEFWPGRVDPTPWFDGRKILVDGKAPAAPEAEALVRAVRPLVDKYIPAL